MFIKAKIRWFDKMTGRGLVRLPSGESIQIDWTAIVSTKRYGWDLGSDEIQELLSDVNSGADCQVRVYRDSHFSAIAYCIIEGEINGRVDRLG